jgi:hypothetical protein
MMIEFCVAGCGYSRLRQAPPQSGRFLLPSAGLPHPFPHDCVPSRVRPQVRGTCPTCGAVEGQPCRHPNGAVMGDGPHAARTRRQAAA